MKRQFFLGVLSYLNSSLPFATLIFGLQVFFSVFSDSPAPTSDSWSIQFNLISIHDRNRFCLFWRISTNFTLLLAATTFVVGIMFTFTFHYLDMSGNFSDMAGSLNRVMEVIEYAESARTMQQQDPVNISTKSTDLIAFHNVTIVSPGLRSLENSLDW